jgi:hypothetical protein
MKMQPFDRKAYEAWVKQVVSLLPARVTCPDCNGSGEGVCSHCGHDTDCETCSGDGAVSPSEIVTPEFYRRVMVFETEKLERWAKGEPIATKDEKGRIVENHNPLNELVEEFQPKKPWFSFPSVVLCLPITEGK